MANFAFVYRNRPENYARLSPEDMQKQMQKWQAWFAEGSQKGWLVNTGDALTKEGRIVDSKKLVADGPIVEAKDIESAAEVAKSCPALAIGGSVEVRPLAGYMPLKR
jgi:hypothetical protein